MRIQQSRQQTIKAGLHAGQAVLIFVAGCLALGVMTKDGGFGGETGFYFALCFLSIPALIYQVMVPMWSRAWRFANPYAYASIDLLFAILWFAASIAVAVWNADGIALGAKSPSPSSSSTSTSTSSHPSTTKRVAPPPAPSASCATFAYGSTTKCQVSKASVGVGMLITLLWAVSAGLALRQVLDYRRTGVMPGGSSSGGPGRRGGFPGKKAGAIYGGVDDRDKDAWSANVDEDLEARPSREQQTMQQQQSSSPPRYSFGGVGGGVDDRRRYGQEVGGEDGNDEQGLLSAAQGQPHHQRSDSRDEDGMAHPGRPFSFASVETAPPVYSEDMVPSALSPGGFVQREGFGASRVQFPGGNYNSMGI